MTYGIVSDSHYHKWSAFSTINTDGINSRLQIQLDETLRAAKAVNDAGGKYLFHGGDCFHVRGNLPPSVLNPVLDTYRAIQNMGVQVVMIPGNHDLEGKESERIGNASTALADTGVLIEAGSFVINENHDGHKIRVALIPWCSTVERLQMKMDELGLELDKSHGGRSHFDLIIHAPVDGVIIGIPDHGLTAEDLDAFGFRRVFAGHYHHHKHFEGTDVYSIGALTHQTWGDVGTKAGFLLIDEEVRYNASHAPKFIDLDPEWDETEIALQVDGNYVRARLEVEQESDVGELRELLEAAGATGVTIHPVKSHAPTARTGATVKSGATLEQSLSEFIKVKSYSHPEALARLCAEILTEAEAQQ